MGTSDTEDPISTRARWAVHVPSCPLEGRQRGVAFPNGILTSSVRKVNHHAATLGADYPNSARVPASPALTDAVPPL
jgi:hypothetical protein